MKDAQEVKKNLREAFDEMIEKLQAARDAIDTPELFPVPADERNLAEGYRYLMGFLLGGIWIHDGDTGLLVLLVPPGAVLLLVAVGLCAWAFVGRD